MNTVSKMSRDRKLVWGLSVTLVIVVVLLIAALVKPDSSNTNNQASDPSGNESSSSESADTPDGNEAVDDEAVQIPDLSRRDANDVAALGEIDAPLVLIEYADYRCPYCGVFARESLPKIVDEYVDKGLVRVEWRDVPIFGEESQNAAVAVRAAGKQGKFWEYNEVVFSYSGSGHQDLPKERLIEIAEEIGIQDLELFKADLENPELQAQVYQDYTEAMQIGVNSTPTFIIGQTPIMGAQPIEIFRQIIEAELADIQ